MTKSRICEAAHLKARVTSKSGIGARVYHTLASKSEIYGLVLASKLTMLNFFLRKLVNRSVIGAEMTAS